MTYQDLINKLRDICTCNETEVNPEQIKGYFLSLDQSDALLNKVIEEYSYEQLPINAVVHKEQGFEIKLLQTSEVFDSEIHDHPSRDVHGIVLNGSIDMTVFDLKREISSECKQIKKMSEQTYKQGDYFLIGRNKNNYHRVISQKPAVILELVTPAITAKLDEDTLKYEIDQVLDDNIFQVKKLEKDL